MMCFNDVVTIFSFDKAKGDFVKKGTFHAWVRRMRRLRNIKGGTYFCDNFDVRVPIDSFDVVDAGDMIFFGDTDEFFMSKCRKIAVVSKNNFGISPHWHMEAEYEYR